MRKRWFLCTVLVQRVPQRIVLLGNPACPHTTAPIAGLERGHCWFVTVLSQRVVTGAWFLFRLAKIFDVYFCTSSYFIVLNNGISLTHLWDILGLVWRQQLPERSQSPQRNPSPDYQYHLQGFICNVYRIWFSWFRNSSSLRTLVGVQGVKWSSDTNLSTMIM